MAQTRKVIKLFVTDFDRCALTTVKYNFVSEKPEANPRSDSLSGDLITIANQGNYAGFYGCTHRSYWGIREGLAVKQSLSYAARWYSPAPISDKNYFTFGIVENLTNAIKAPCLGISTPDDLSGAASAQPPALRCGYAYTHALKAYEQYVFEHPNQDGSYNFNLTSVKPAEYLDEDDLRDFSSTSKNNQLLQIAEHARAHFGDDANIEIHFLDDLKPICENIVTMNSSFPLNVIIKSYQHYPREGIIADIDRPTAIFDNTPQGIAQRQLDNIARTQRAERAAGSVLGGLGGLATGATIAYFAPAFIPYVLYCGIGGALVGNKLSTRSTATIAKEMGIDLNRTLQTLNAPDEKQPAIRSPNVNTSSLASVVVPTTPSKWMSPGTS